MAFAALGLEHTLRGRWELGQLCLRPDGPADGDSPPQLGQIPRSLVSAQSAQNVHSNEQIRASRGTPEAGGHSTRRSAEAEASSSFRVKWVAVGSSRIAEERSNSTHRGRSGPGRVSAAATVSRAVDGHMPAAVAEGQAARAGSGLTSTRFS